MKKTKSQYRKEALSKVLKLNRKPKRKSTLFSKLSTGNYLVRMVKQERK
jgi:hypothetical protein